MSTCSFVVFEKLLLMCSSDKCALLDMHCPPKLLVDIHVERRPACFQLPNENILNS